MELTPTRLAMIEAHVAETRRLMTDLAFELNDLVRFALSAARSRPGKVYYAMDPVNDSIRDWEGLSKRITRLAAQIEGRACAARGSALRGGGACQRGGGPQDGVMAETGRGSAARRQAAPPLMKKGRRGALSWKFRS